MDFVKKKGGSAKECTKTSQEIQRSTGELFLKGSIIFNAMFSCVFMKEQIYASYRRVLSLWYEIPLLTRLRTFQCCQLFMIFIALFCMLYYFFFYYYICVLLHLLCFTAVQFWRDSFCSFLDWYVEARELFWQNWEEQAEWNAHTVLTW